MAGIVRPGFGAGNSNFNGWFGTSRQSPAPDSRQRPQSCHALGSGAPSKHLCQDRDKPAIAGIAHRPDSGETECGFTVPRHLQGALQHSEPRRFDRGRPPHSRHSMVFRTWRRKEHRFAGNFFERSTRLLRHWLARADRGPATYGPSGPHFFRRAQSTGPRTHEPSDRDTQSVRTGIAENGSLKSRTGAASTGRSGRLPPKPVPAEVRR